MKNGRRMLLAAWVLMVTMVLPATASSFQLIRVADQSTPVPNGTGHFNDLFPPALSGNTVAFAAFTNSGIGVYLFEAGTLSRVADTSTVIPNGSGTFTAFNIETVVTSDGNVAFIGLRDSEQQGIYLFDGSAIRRAADLATPIPNGAGTFTGFGHPALSGGRVTFVGTGNSEQQGIYLFDGSTLTRVADKNTPIPNGTGTFTGFSDPGLGAPAISGGMVAFRGTGESFREGIYLFDGGPLSRVADQNTPMPQGTHNFDSFAKPLLSDGTVAFLAFGGFNEGIYLFDGGTLRRAVDTNTPIPNGTGNFSFAGLGVPVLSGSNVAFQASGSGGQRGIYLFHENTLSRAADLHTAIPNGVDTFSDFFPPAIGGHTVGFVGGRVTPEQQGVYLFDGSTLDRLADTSTPIPGGSGTFQNFRSLALSGDNVVFRTIFPSVGIYLASPGPTPVAALRVGLRNGDDTGTAFDFRVDVYKNASALVASGETRCVRTLVRNPAAASAIDVPFNLLGPPQVNAGDVLSLKVSARIGTNADESRCTGSGASHASATGMRLYYDAAEQASRFDATIYGTSANVYLHSDGGVCTSAQSAMVTTRFLDTTAPTATQAKCKDSGAVKFAGGNVWSEIGTWSMAPLP